MLREVGELKVILGKQRWVDIQTTIFGGADQPAGDEETKGDGDDDVDRGAMSCLEL